MSTLSYEDAFHLIARTGWLRRAEAALTTQLTLSQTGMLCSIAATMLEHNVEWMSADIFTLSQNVNCSPGEAVQIVRDLRLLGLVQVTDGRLMLTTPLPPPDGD